MKRSSELNYSSKHPFRTLYYLLSENKPRILFAFIFFCIKHSPVWVFPIIAANIINIANNSSKYPITDIWKNLVVISILLLQNIPMNMLFVRLFSKTLRDLEARLRNALIRRIHQLSIAFHKEYKSGKLHSKILRDVEAVVMLARQFWHSGIVGILNISAALIITFTRHPSMVLFYLITIPLGAILVRTFSSKLQLSNLQFRNVIEGMSAAVSEMINMLPISRAHGVEKDEVKKMDRKLNKIKARGLRLDFFTGLFGAFAYVSFQIFRVSCLGVTGYLAYKGKISVGDIALYQFFFMMIMRSVTIILNSYPMLTKGFDSIRSIGEILECPDIEENKGKKQIEKVIGSFKFDSIDFIYKTTKTHAIRSFSLNVKPGECIAFVGESGAGKSTLMNLVIGFYRPLKGKILLDNRDMNSLDLRTYRKFLSVVPQNTVLFSGSVRENITFGISNVKEKEIKKAVKMANAEEFINKLPHGLDTSLGEYGNRLSGGQRQRIAIARAFIRNPKVIIFDEATSHLDLFSEKQIQEAMQRLARKRTTFIVAHRLSTIRNADRIVVLKKGRCVETGSFNQLIAKKGEFFRLRSLQK